MVGHRGLEPRTNGLRGASLASAHLLIKYLRRLPCSSRSLDQPWQAKASRTLVQEWLQWRRRDASIPRDTELAALSWRFSSAINFCATQLLANSCRQVEQLPKTVARGRCRESDALEAIKAHRVQKFKDRQTALHVNLRHVIGMRLAGSGEYSR